MSIAVLAVQGAFAEHAQVLKRLGEEVQLIRNKEDWDTWYTGSNPAGLVLPGGESTAMLRILRDELLLAPIRDAIAGGLPVFATCAGLILLASQVDNDARERLGTLQVTVHRNAYGRQLGSFAESGTIHGVGQFPLVFIRAPYVTQVGPGVQVICEHDGHIVGVQQGKQVAVAFHPELSNDDRLHQYWLTSIEG